MEDKLMKSSQPGKTWSSSPLPTTLSLALLILSLCPFERETLQGTAAAQTRSWGKLLHWLAQCPRSLGKDISFALGQGEFLEPQTER